MPHNGAAALQLVAPEPLIARPTAPDLPIEKKIGEATADACIILSASMIAFHETGRLPATLKEAGGEKIARLATLELDSFEIDDFAGIARREGLIRLRQLLDTEFFQKHGANAGDKTLAIILDGVLEIVARVVAVERVLRAN
jgi:hypothetical protein